MERAEYQGPPGQDPKELFEVWEREQVNDSIWRMPNTKEFSVYAETIEFLIDTVPHFATFRNITLYVRCARHQLQGMKTEL